MQRRKTLLIVLMITVLFISLSACSKKEEATVQKKPATKKQQSTPTNTTSVLMLGRSVMGGWFSHWNAENNTYKHDGFTLYYGEIESPPDIIDSARDRIDGMNPNVKIVFFKMCFVDFAGGSREEARDNMNRNKGYVQDIYDIVVKEKGQKLIVGNALPQVKQDTTEDLVWSHLEYNQFLSDFAAQHPGQVYVFDEYGVLTDANGNLKPEYAQSAEDSHPNEAGYSAMDAPFFDLLATLNP